MPVKSLGDLYVWPAYFLFFLMVVFPSVLSLLYVKAFLFALLLAFVAVAAFARTSWHPRVVIWTISLAAVSLVFGIRGLFLDAPGASKSIQVYVFWPLVYLFLIGGINCIRILQGLEKTLIFATVFTGVFGVYYSLSQANILPQIPHLDALFSMDELGADFYEGHVEMRFPGLNSLPFLVPFLIATVMTRGSQAGGRLVSSRIWVWTALLFSLPVVLLSGRRAIQLVTILAPFLTLALGYVQPPKERLLLLRSLRRLAVVLALLAVLAIPLLGAVFDITYEGVANRFTEGFDFSPSNQSDSSTARVEQYLALIEGWAQNPLIGRGLGASAHASIRSETMPWAYELYYLALLYQTGLFGFVAYTAGIVWIYYSGIRIIKCGGVGSQFMVPILVGMSGFLIATGTNPYLARFDGIWAIFLPLAFTNHWLLLRDQARNTSSVVGR